MSQKRPAESAMSNEKPEKRPRLADPTDAEATNENENNIDNSTQDKSVEVAELIRQSGAKLVEAVRARDHAKVTGLLEESTVGVYFHTIDAEPSDPATAMSALMLAAHFGERAIVEALLEAGAQWNALDDSQRTAGDYARLGGHNESRSGGISSTHFSRIVSFIVFSKGSELYEFLVDHGCRVEMILGALNQTPLGTEPEVDVDLSEDSAPKKETMNSDYLKQNLIYEDGRLLDEDRQPVMMGWEKPLMDRHAEIICKSKRAVMNVGFGLGLIDAAIHKCGVSSHTIVEPHKDVLKEIARRGVDKLQGVTVVPHTWQVAVNEGHLLTYDGIFFDTWGEYYEDLRAFHEELPALLNPGGIYSFFNGLGGHNQYFHDVYCRVAELELTALGFQVTWETVRLDDEALADQTWREVNGQYWKLSTYRYPICVYANPL